MYFKPFSRGKKEAPITRIVSSTKNHLLFLRQHFSSEFKWSLERIVVLPNLAKFRHLVQFLEGYFSS